MFDNITMTYRAQTVVCDVIGFAMENGDAVVRPEHLLKVLLDLGPETVVHHIFAMYDATPQSLQDSWMLWELEATMPLDIDEGEYLGMPVLHPQFEHLLYLAGIEARHITFCDGVVDIDHLAVALVLDPSTQAGRFLNEHGIFFEKLRSELSKFREKKVVPTRV